MNDVRKEIRLCKTEAGVQSGLPWACYEFPAAFPGFAGHFPGQPLLPGVCMLKAAAVTLAGQEIDLTQREFDLAVVFLQNVGRVLGRDELLSTVWAREADVDTRTVDTHTSRLRKKLGLAGESGLMLTSVYGQGYRLDTVKA